MDDYDYNKETLRPVMPVVSTSSHPPVRTHKPRNKTHSKSKQKHIVTSFSKKSITQNQGALSPRSPTPLSPSYKQCQSEYYIKTAESQRERKDLPQPIDEIKVKQRQVESLSARLVKAQLTITQLQAEIALKDATISKLQTETEGQMVKALQNLAANNSSDLAYECHALRIGQDRLLKMLQGTEEYRSFADLGVLDGGMDLLLAPRVSQKSALDASAQGRVHFCSCNKEFIPESAFWVPKGIYSVGRQFIAERKGQLTGNEIELLLYELNRFWREREKKIINMFKGKQASRATGSRKQNESVGKMTSR